MNKPYLKLKRRIEDAGYTSKELAAQVGMGKCTLSRRLNSDTSDKWIGKEIVSICRIVGIPQEQIGEYFFPKVEKGESV